MGKFTRSLIVTCSIVCHLFTKDAVVSVQPKVVLDYPRPDILGILSTLSHI